MRHSSQRLWALLGIVAFLVIGDRCRGGEPACGTEPAGEVRAFFLSPTEESVTRRFHGIVTDMRSTTGGFLQVTLRDSLGRTDSLKYRGSSAGLPLRVGGAYDVRIDFEPRVPPSSAIVVHDAAGLLFVAATDQRVGARVLEDGVPGFALQLVPSPCESRARERCYESITNAILRVTHGGESQDLYNGMSAEVGDYRVTCLTAQMVVYRDRCADAGLSGVSYTIVRTDADAPQR